MRQKKNTHQKLQNKHDLLAYYCGDIGPLLSASDRNPFGFAAFHLAEKKGPILCHQIYQ